MVIKSTLAKTAEAMVAPGKGLFATDMWPKGLTNGWWGTMREPRTEQSVREFQETMFRTPGLAEHLSGVIVFEDVLDCQSKDGTSFQELLAQQGVLIGITPTTRWQALGGSPEERIPTGLDGLPRKMDSWKDRGVSFVKWRVGAKIGEGLPTRRALLAGAHSVAECAALAQEHGLVPIVEPEAEMKGAHSLERHFEVTERFLHLVLEALYEYGVKLDGIVLKTNMVLSGSEQSSRADVATVAAETLRCMRQVLPPAVPGIGFLSGGQTQIEATEHLNAMNALGPQPWNLTFSYGRGIGEAAMGAWDGDMENGENNALHKALAHRARMNGLASLGQWSPDLEAAGQA